MVVCTVMWNGQVWRVNIRHCTALLTISHRPGVISEADSEGVQQAGDVLPHCICGELEGQLSNAGTGSFPHCMVVCSCCLNVVANLRDGGETLVRCWVREKSGCGGRKEKGCVRW